MDLYSAERFSHTIFPNLQKKMDSNELDLTKTPFLHRQLLTKLDITGATILKGDGCFHNRFQGSGGFSVLPDGTLINSRTKNLLENDRLSRLKKKPVKKRLSGIQGNPNLVRILKPKKKNGINAKKIRHRTIALVNAQLKKEMYSFTVTFPPEVKEDLAYILYNNWLTYCRKYVRLRDYSWVREYQKNGTVHFHVLIPHFFHVVNANKAMRTVLRTQIINGSLDWHLKKAKRYNGVDIGKNRKTKEVTNFAKPREKRALLAYILKYMSKTKPKEKEEGSSNHYAWHNSRAFTAMVTSLALTKEEALQLEIRSQLNFDSTFTNEWFTHILWNNHSPPRFVPEVLTTVNREILEFLGNRKRRELYKNLSHMIPVTRLIGSDPVPIYRQHKKELREIIPQPKREKLGNQELQELIESVKNLPTLEEWKQLNSLTKNLQDENL